jgi:hypothetical protein
MHINTSLRPYCTGLNDVWSGEQERYGVSLQALGESSAYQLMHINKSLRPTVGADLSRTPPIYRPLPAVPLSRLIYETALSAFAGYSAILIKKPSISLVSSYCL